MKIMVAGLEAACCEMTKSLRAIGEVVEVFEVSSGEAAVNVYRNTNPTVIFIDVIQKGMTGIESARSIREQDARIKIILVSENFNKEFLLAARDIGLNGYLVKSADAILLEQVVRDVEEGEFYFFMS